MGVEPAAGVAGTVDSPVPGGEALVNLNTADQAALGAFPDADGVSGWARATMAWAVEAGVLNGVGTEDGSRELQATRELTRAEMATMMVNAIEVGVLDFGA